MTAIWRKVWTDFWHNKTRTLLVTLSIAVGVFAVGLVASTLAIVKKDMAADYFAVNPHTARIYTQDFDRALLEDLRSLPGVESIDASYTIWLKIASRSGKQYPINLNSIMRLSDIKVDQLVYEAGATSLADNEIFLERQGAEGMGLNIGDTVTMILKDGQPHALKLVGTVHDVNANPFKFSSSTSGYVTPATMETLGGSRMANFVNLVTAGSHTDSVHVRQVADRVAKQVTVKGYTVYNINVNHPGQHPAQSIVDTVLALLGALSVLVVFLSAFLVTNTISALMGQQIRQIGVMKALGATIYQVMGIYLALVLAFGMTALLISVPLGGLATYGLTRWLIGMLNANPSPFSIPATSLVIQLVIGLAVPVLGALIPVIGGARLTLRQAITSYGLEANGKPGWFDRVMEVLPWLPRPMILSLRNTFRRKGRLALTLVTLILGGAIFIAMLGVREAMYLEITRSFGYYQADVNVALAHPYPINDLLKAIDGVQGVSAVEGWNTVTANVPHVIDDSSDQITLHAPPANTKLLNPVMITGRWLQPEDSNSIVVSNHFTKLRPDVKVGDTILVRLNEKDTPFQVVGIFRMAGTFPSPFTYINDAAFNKISGVGKSANELKIVTDVSNQARQNEVLQAVQTRFSKLGIEATLQTGEEIITQQRSTINTLISLLLLMGVLIAVVGGLGLMGTIGMNVLERTREIGVMRSIGAENGMIFRLIVVEGALIGLISWAMSTLVAIPITQFLDKTLGQQLMTIPITYVFSTQGMLIWLVVALVLSALSSLLPARSAVRLTVRDVLAYE